MKHIYLKHFSPCLIIFGLLFITACTEEWGEHYDESNFNLPDKSLNAYIQESPDLSIFSNMLSITGFDKNLDASQSYTVWVPTNDALSGVDTTNKALVQEIVLNHIARSRYTTSGVQIQVVPMLNGKFVNFANNGPGFQFGDYMVLNENISTINGLVHIIDGFVPYSYNLWEYIDRAESFDSLRQYLYSHNTEEFDAVNSVEIGVDSEGHALYDSVFISKNDILEKIGGLSSEDSIYTVIMPNNTAWSEAYGRINSFFNFPDDAGSAQRQVELTKWTLIKDMVFEGKVEEPSSLDSIITTTGNVYYNPLDLFQNTELKTLSNGLLYITSQMPYQDTESWFTKIKVEAEDQEGRDNANSNIFPRTSYGTGVNVSNSKYILVDPVSAQSSVEFSIPNTLSATYNIYCVFVPASISDATNTIPTKVTFKLTYIRRQSGSTFLKKITPDNNVTNPTGLTKMLVDKFDFEYANVVDEDYDRVAVKLEVLNDVSTEEELSGNFSRTMRIDCIILEPVKE